MSLKSKTLAGLAWSLADQFGGKFIGFFITIILSRLLMPEDFGVIAMLSVFISIGGALMESGLTSSLIRTTDASQEDFSTIFWFNLAGSIVIYLLLFLLAPYIALFYKQDILSSIVRVYGLTFIINAFFSVQNARLTKNMNFKAQTAISIPSNLGGGLVGVICAYQGYGPWSLVWMNMFAALLSTVLHWVASDWHPTFVFNKESFKQHFFFGYKMALSGIIDTFYRNIYVIIIGKYYSAAQLGFYSRADSISQLPIANISAAIGKVTYPMLSTIAGDDGKLKQAYRQLLQQVIFWNAPILIFLSVIAQPLISFLLTDRWLPVVPYFQILCVAGIMYPLHAYNLNILKVKGRSDLILQLEVIKKTLCVVGILSVVSFGVYGLLYFQLLFSFGGYFINSFYSGKIINYPVKEQIADIYPAITLAAAIGYLCYLLDGFLVHAGLILNLGRITVIAFAYFTTYISCSYLLKLAAITDFKHLILKK